VTCPHLGNIDRNGILRIVCGKFGCEFGIGELAAQNTFAVWSDVEVRFVGVEEILASGLTFTNIILLAICKISEIAPTVVVASICIAAYNRTRCKTCNAAARLQCLWNARFVVSHVCATDSLQSLVQSLVFGDERGLLTQLTPCKQRLTSTSYQSINFLPLRGGHKLWTLVIQ
jgi:hypothetical protein